MADGRHNPIIKYLTDVDFCRYCEANRVEASSEVLEDYEKRSLLMPVYRLEYPEELVKLRRASRLDSLPTSLENKPEWKPIDELEARLSTYQHHLPGGLEETLKTGHPLDHACKENNPFLYRPVSKRFRPWREYSIIVETAEGHQIPVPRVEHYYAQWQIFVLDGLNQNVKKVPISTVSEWEQSFQSKPEWRETLTKVHPSKVLEFEECFQTLADFRMYELLIWNIEWEGVEDVCLEGERAERFEKRVKDLATVHYNKHSPERWIQFIRKLVELHVRYEEREKLKLSKELKRILISAVNINLHATGWGYERLCNEVDGFVKSRAFIHTASNGSTIYPGKLEQIFPNETKLLREKTKPILQSEVTEMNKFLPNGTPLDPSKIDDLIDELLSKGYISILTHIMELNRLWFSGEDLHREDKLWSHLVSLTVSIESLGREWFPRTTELQYIFQKAFSGYKTLNPGRNCNASNPSEFIKKLSSILQRHHSDPCGSCLLIANLVRNYVAHGGRYTSEILGNKFVTVFKAILTTLLYLFHTKP